MRIRLTLDIRTTPGPARHPHPRRTPHRRHTPTPTETTTPDDTTPFGFSLDGTSLSSDTDRAEPYDDGRGAEYEDDDAHEDGRP
ncbi:hypothetical protein Q3A86_33170 [Streptomyces sp. NBUA17]|uniref:hypothetical protein n=1 Tax=Streptomyces sp. NBUA17 TaxID=3062275 RepID=UPI0037D9D380